MSSAANPRQYIIQIIFLGVASVILLRLFFLQNFESKYKVMANDIAIYKKVVYPPRGVIYDRKGKVMLSNTTIYDLMVTPRNMKNFDTAQFCVAMGLDLPGFLKIMKGVQTRNIDVRQSTFMEQLSPEQTARFQENAFSFQGFELVERNIREYKNATAGIVLGYIGEVSLDMLKKDRYASYRQGDYTGLSGLELQYEEALRGQRGVHFMERDKFNRPKDPYRNGALDTMEISGKSLELYMDADLQSYAEKLMQNKVGSVVAIDPQTGGILTMVSSPCYDPNLLRGRDRAKNYGALYREATRPLFNRATQAAYPPGSTIKPMTGLVALSVGAITPSFGLGCFGSYNYCGRPIACEHHDAGHAANFRLALAHSCNSYFSHIFRMTIDYKGFGSVKVGLQKWHDYFSACGFGRQSGIDLPFEGKGLLPDTTTYNKMYRGVWNSCTVVFVGMGQGELALTPLQMANSMAIIANKGFYYIPHFVKSIGKNENDPQLKKYRERKTVLNIPDSSFSVVQQAMQDVVESGTAIGAKVDGVTVCAKTGTAENKAIVNGAVIKMANHSMFVAFAPREHPRIAIAVAVENSGFGATWAAPIASLLIEKYLKDSVSVKRKAVEDKMFNAKLINKYVYTIDSAIRLRDANNYAARVERKRAAESMKRAQDSLMFVRWMERRGRKK
ncbi:penicillin-binding protein 2 [Flavipsychrobacter stenotrophus]|uniref:Penicillin-binding protein 2 n=1 Tax=Flavipsychrobacter stenotrophus TaxID=2077091 RepID=A0A2S7STP9_9BACT|nr:penicillin-binding protein 2 [Flavipsychrobacter stenotrophus]PQJ10290.1 penicillin-binding protein 2 [Flavipsychrobacter stenotrophus]